MDSYTSTPALYFENISMCRQPMQNFNLHFWLLEMLDTRLCTVLNLSLWFVSSYVMVGNFPYWIGSVHVCIYFGCIEFEGKTIVTGSVKTGHSIKH